MNNDSTPSINGLPTMNRRSFAQTAAIAGAAASLPLSARGNFSGSDTIKLAVVGCGGRGSGAANQAMNGEGVELVAMADMFSDRLETSLSNLKKQHEGKVKVGDDQKFIGPDSYKDAIAQADLVILATPPGFRPIHFEEAIRQGKHVFMEKPVAVDAPGVRRVLAAAKEADKKGLKVVCGLQRRYQNVYKESLKKVAEEGAIGDIVSGQIYWNSGGVWVRSRDAVEKALGRPATELEYQMYNWYYFNWMCGDHIVEQHVHNIDIANWFIGAHPVHAQGMGGREIRKDESDFGEIFDHHYVEFHYPGGQIINSQSRHQKGTYSAVFEQFTGTKGRLEISGRPKANITGLDGSKIWRYRGKEDPDPYQTEHDVLQEHIRQDKPINNAVYTAESTFTAILGRYATYSGKIVKWDEAMEKGTELFPGLDKLTPASVPPVKAGPDGLYPAPVPGQFDPFA